MLSVGFILVSNDSIELENDYSDDDDEIAEEMVTSEFKQQQEHLPDEHSSSRCYLPCISEKIDLVFLVLY
jgi:hypothetical protein